MKMEKISDTQVRFTLNKNDLVDREIKISELAYGSEKAQKLFRDMMEKASDEFGFDSNNIPLMIEAVPLSTESIMIIVTKVSEEEELEEKLSNITPNKSKNIRKFKKKSNSSKENNDAKKVYDLNKFNHYKRTYLYSFKNLDNIIDATSNILNTFKCDSCVFKNPIANKYYLALHCKPKDKFMNDVDKILNEYGDKINSSELGISYLKEHAETIIKENAIEKLKLI